MSKYVILSGSFLISLLASGAAFADDASVDVVGPSGRSSISLEANAFDYHNDADFTGTTTLGGTDHQTGNSLILSGVYAVSSKVNITAGLPWNYDSKNVFTWQGNSEVSNQNGIGENLGISAIAIDNNGPGFKLVTAAGLTHTEGYDAVYYANVEPQYRFDEKLLLTSTFGVQHESGFAGATYANLNLVWKVTPSFTVIPTVGVARYRANGYWYGYTQSSEELSATYHIDHDWSVFASVTHGAATTRTSDYYVNDLANGHSYDYGIGLRRFF